MTETPIASACSNSVTNSLPAYLVVVVEVFVAVVIGLGLMALGVNGGTWILGGIGAGALVFYGYRQWFDDRAQPNCRSRKVGQIIVGVAIGLSLQNDTLTMLAAQFPIFLGLPLFLLIGGATIGYLFSHFSRTDLLTSLLATTPGNIGVMASIAADYNRNTPLVSLVQLLRFTSIILFVPMLVDVPASHSLSRAIDSLSSEIAPTYLADWSYGLMILAIAGIAVYLGNQIKFPVATFICAIGVGLVADFGFNLATASNLHFHLPLSINLLGQILLGTTIGEYWAINPKLQRWEGLMAIVPVLLTIVVGLIAATLLHALLPWDWLTCLLVAAPGGSPEMIWIALTLQHNVETVTSAHLIRLLTINISLPLLVSLALWREERVNDRRFSNDACQETSSPATEAEEGSR